VECELAEPEAYDVDSAEAKLVAALGLGAPLLAGEDAALATASDAGAATATSSTTAGVLGSGAAKLGVAAGAAALIAVSAVVWPERSAPARRASDATAASQPRAHGATPGPAPAVPNAQARSEVEPAAAPDSPATERAALQRESGSAAPATQAGDLALRREIAQLARIKALLDPDPAAAYRLARAGHREFARGMLREEREALAVLALWQMGREAEAKRRSRMFLERYPHSAHRERIELRMRSERDDVGDR
jgi:hypothetical protein